MQEKIKLKTAEYIHKHKISKNIVHPNSLEDKTSRNENIDQLEHYCQILRS